MSSAEGNERDVRVLWDEMLTSEVENNLKQIAKTSISNHSLRAKMLLKVTFAELRGIIMPMTIAYEAVS
jgi:hypothetical protein